MTKVYVLHVDHSPPYSEHDDWKLHSVHITHDGARRAGTTRLRGGQPNDHVSEAVIEASFTITPFELED